MPKYIKYPYMQQPSFVQRSELQLVPKQFNGEQGGSHCPPQAGICWEQVGPNYFVIKQQIPVQIRERVIEKQSAQQDSQELLLL